MRTRVTGAFDQFVDAGRKDDREVAALLRHFEIDIAVDLMGFTHESRPGIFALRPAPVHVNYLGFPATTGAAYIDYIIADRFVVPSEQARCYSENIVFLPDSFQANDSKRSIGESPRTRAEAGLPDDGFVFCAFSNSYKITPAMFDVWMRLLRQAEGSVFWLLGGSAAVETNLRREAQASGIAADRLIFAPRLGYSEYLRRYQLADLFLDMAPFNAGATASDALWAGLPLITCTSEAFAGRMAGSLLHAVGLPQLVTSSIEDYERTALALVRDPPAIDPLKATLAQNRVTARCSIRADFGVISRALTRRFGSAIRRESRRRPLRSMPRYKQRRPVRACTQYPPPPPPLLFAPARSNPPSLPLRPRGAAGLACTRTCVRFLA